MAAGPEPEGGDPVCALCGRPIPPGARRSQHHLIPRLKGGKNGPVVVLHNICHKEIHATLTEAELARGYNTAEALRGHPHLARFIRWISNKPPEFDARTLRSVRRRGRR